MNGLVDETCKTCVHHAYMGNGTTGEPYCGYILNTRKPRPCPAGEGCTVYKKRKRKRRATDFRPKMD